MLLDMLCFRHAESLYRTGFACELDPETQTQLSYSCLLNQPDIGMAVTSVLMQDHGHYPADR